MRILKLLGLIIAAVLASLLAALGLWHLLDGTPSPAAPVPMKARFDGELMVLVDGDMSATAYADGRLHRVEGAQDLLMRLPTGGAEAATLARVSNTVMGWPGATEVVGDAVFVVESRGSAPADVEVAMPSVYEGLPFGTRLQRIDRATGTVDAMEVCTQPLSVDAAPGGDWLLVACGDDDGEIAVVPISGDGMNAVRRFDLDLPRLPGRPWDAGAGYAVVHPDGRAAAVLSANTGLTLVRFALDANGVPVAAQAEDTLVTDGYLSVARWSNMGAYLLVADVGWGAAPTDALFNRAGSIRSYALDPRNSKRGEVGRASVGKSPEAFEMDRGGTLLAVVNMERTYLPGGALSLVPGRASSSLSLVAFDPKTGGLTTLGAPVGFRGVLPEDAVFDADGDALAVVVYQDHDAPRSDGWLAFFDIDRSGPVPVARLTDRRVALPRGGHDLVVIDP